MADLPGLFDSFDNLDAISAESLIQYLKHPPTILQLENYLGNKILYPQSLPTTDLEMKIDLAILREALKINSPKRDQIDKTLLGGYPFLNTTLRRILIPERFLRYVNSLIDLTWAFVDGLLLNRNRQDQFEDIWTVVLVSDFEETVGSVIMPRFNSLKEIMQLSLLNKNYTLAAGSLTLIVCPKSKCQITYKFEKGQLLGKNESAVEVSGGKLGLMIDGRRK